MKKLIYLTSIIASLFLFSNVALAGDVAPPPADAGFYLGVHGGGNAPTDSLIQGGWNAGAHLGYQYEAYRGEVTYTYFRNRITPYHYYNFNMDTNNVMGNVYYDFFRENRFTILYCVFVLVDFRASSILAHITPKIH